MFSQKFISRGVKGLAKLNIFIIALYIEKKKMQYIALNKRCFHPVISEERQGLSLILDNIHEKQTLHTSNKCHDDVASEASGIITKFEEQNNTIPHQINNTLKEGHKNYLEIIEALARIVHLIGKQDIAFRGTEEKAEDS